MAKFSRKKESVLKRLEKRVKLNVKRGEGITNITVLRFCTLVCNKFYFRGVFSADRIPRTLSQRKNFVAIVNLAGSREYKGHFVTLVGSSKSVYYVDSYGLPSVDSRVNYFLKLCNRPVLFNLRQIQHFDSAYCALYAILFALYFEKKAPFRLKFKRRSLLDNDKLCCTYIRKLIDYQ